MKRPGRKTAAVFWSSSNACLGNETAMNRSAKNKRGLLLLTGAFFFTVALSANKPVFAQYSNETAQLLNRIKQLENQVQTLSRAVYRGDANAQAALAGGGAGDTTAIANTDARMSQIEDQQRKITGDIEKISHDVEQLKDRLDKMQADTEQRFQQQQPGSTAAPATAPENETAAPSATAGTLGTLSSHGSSETAGGPAETLYEDAFAQVRDTNYDAAETKFKQFLTQYPNHPLAANAQYWLGETYYVRGNYKQAAKRFAQGYQDFPKSPKAADSLYKLALSLSKMGNKDDACLSLRQFQKEFQTASGPLARKADQEIKELGCK
jgi:tol-pal system protein YbgF